MKTIALIVAAGSSQRFGGEVPKQFRTVCDRPLLSWTIEKFEKAQSIDNIVIVTAEEYLLHTSQKVVDPYGFNKVTKIVKGGDSRRESVINGLEALPLATDFVAIHDGARPLVSSKDIDQVVEVAQKERAAILAQQASDTIKRCADGFVLNTIDRRILFQAQTPQVFQYDLILSAHKKAQANNDQSPTDDALLIEEKGFKVKVVEPTSPNFKVTTPTDLYLAEKLLERERDE